MRFNYFVPGLIADVQNPQHSEIPEYLMCRPRGEAQWDTVSMINDPEYAESKKKAADEKAAAERMTMM